MTTTNEHNRIETGLGPLTDRVLNTILDKLSSDNFREQLSNRIVDPTLGIINRKIKPYIYTMIIAYAILVVLLIIIIWLLVKRRK